MSSQGASTSVYQPLPRLPLEIIGLIVRNFANDRDGFDEMKKCRLISPRWYKAVQDLFRDEFYQKYLTHFDGQNETFAASRSWSYNIFGYYRLNFATLKVSKSDYYLMSSWLRRLTTSNIQNLELHDNILSWKELIKLLSKFPHIVNLTYLQTSKDMYRAEGILQHFQVDSESVSGFRQLVQKHLEYEKITGFLAGLKKFQVHIVHVKIVDLLTTIVSFSEGTLEEFNLNVDFHGFYQSGQVNLIPHHGHLSRSVFNNNLQIKALGELKKFSKSLNKLEITVDESDLPQELKSDNVDNASVFHCRSLIIVSILKMFDKLQDFKAIKQLIINLPAFYINFYGKSEKFALSKFVRAQEGLEKFQISYFDDLWQDFDLEIVQKLKTYLRSLILPENVTKFGFQVSTYGFASIQEFPEYLHKLRVILDETSTWRFIDATVPTFPNCTEMSIQVLPLHWTDFGIYWIAQKFPNLEKIAILTEPNAPTTNPQISNEDLQMIIVRFPNLKYLHFENSTNNISDSALTGLTIEAVHIRRANFANLILPVLPADRPGLPISHLKNLETLIIKTSINPIVNQITDVSAFCAFDNLKKLKHLELTNTNISPGGFEIINQKCQSKTLSIY